MQWSRISNCCPRDRIPFGLIDVSDSLSSPIKRTEIIQDTKNQSSSETFEHYEDGYEDVTFCQICNSHDHEDTMLLCDICDGGYHIFCIGLETIPTGDWFCSQCSNNEDSPVRPPSVNSTIRSRLSHVRTAATQRQRRGRLRNSNSVSIGLNRPPVPSYRWRSKALINLRREIAGARRQRLMESRFRGYEPYNSDDFNIGTANNSLIYLENQAYMLAYRRSSSVGSASKLTASYNRKKRHNDLRESTSVNNSRTLLDSIWEQFDKARKIGDGNNNIKSSQHSCPATSTSSSEPKFKKATLKRSHSSIPSDILESSSNNDTNGKRVCISDTEISKNDVVPFIKDAMRPHWQSGKLKKDQYKEIVRSCTILVLDTIKERNLSHSDETLAFISREIVGKKLLENKVSL